MHGKKLMRGAAVALICLAVAGCQGIHPDANVANGQYWEMGYQDGSNGMPVTVLGQNSYTAGYQAGLAAKNNPGTAKPPNPYDSPKPTPAGSQPPSASGGG